MIKPSLWALPCLLALAAAPGARADDGTDPTDPFPRRQFQALPGKVVGVLGPGSEEMLAREWRKGPAGALYLGTGPGSPRLLYVPVDRKPLIGGLNVPVGEKGQTIKPFRNLSPASPRTVARWGITGPYALEEVEVNGGLGGPGRESFVATAMRPLDGTKDYPLQVNLVVGQLHREFEAYLLKQQGAIDKSLAEARARVPADYKTAGGREKAEAVLVTWLPETDHLRVVFQARITEKANGPVRPGRTPAPTDDGTPPPVPASVSGLLTGVEVSMTYEVSKKGVPDGSRPVPLRAFQKAFTAPLPPGEDAGR